MTRREVGFQFVSNGETIKELKMENHDFYDSDASDRIQKSEWRSPRVVVVDVSNGIKFWGELAAGDVGQVCETTLTDRVFDPIEREIDSGKNAGSVMVDGVEYVFVVHRHSSA